MQKVISDNGYRELFPWSVKHPGSEADSPPTSAEVKKTGLYIQSPIRL
jgi:hypothetical protein